jgi:ribosome biogenesis protein ENP2
LQSLGPAPKWCSFLDNLTEELEESDVVAVYDDYKFVTEKELHDIGLGHLIGTSLLRAYMHGYFMDMRLYRKAKAVIQPFQFDDFKKRKIREKILEQRSNRMKFSTLPKVNKELAYKYLNQPNVGSGSKKLTSNLLQDERFKVMFENPDYEIDKAADEYRLLNPVLSKLDNKKAKKLETVFSAVDEVSVLIKLHCKNSSLFKNLDCRTSWKEKEALTTTTLETLRQLLNLTTKNRQSKEIKRPINQSPKDKPSFMNSSLVKILSFLTLTAQSNLKRLQSKHLQIYIN